jgi:L-arabinose isomerase
MNSLVLTAAMQLISGGPVHNNDLLFADTIENACTLSHCGNSAISLAAQEPGVRLEHVRLMDQGVVTIYPGAPGRVTLANLCGRKGTYRLACYAGEAIPTEMVFPGIPVKVRLDVPVDAFLKDTAAFGAGHHWMIAYGDVSASLARFAELTHLRTIGLDAGGVHIR